VTDKHKHRQVEQSAFVLHHYPYRETSLVLEVFSQQCGRIALIARGARRPRSLMRGLLMAFQPLTLSWFGKHELRTLHSAEWQGGQPQLQGTALLCGFYLNELLLNLLVRDDPHEQLFNFYQDTLQKLAQGCDTVNDYAATLRSFEKRLLQELGYALQLAHEADTHAPILPDVSYQYVFERGPVRDMTLSPCGTKRDVTQKHINININGASLASVPVWGKTLLHLAVDDFSDAVSAQQSKQLMRMLLNQHLAGKTLHTRELIIDFQNNRNA
jgi:DNA repair protein RecO (recombination protein O)